MNAKEKIIELVTATPGIKLMSLIPKMVEFITEKNTNVPDLVEKMVLAGEIIEVEYITPQMNYRTKSLLFPKGTKVVRRKAMGEKKED